MSFKRIIIAIIATIPLILGISVIGTQAARATSCSGGNFFYQDIADSSLYATGEGHNNPIQVTGSASEFCLVDSGTNNWFEFMDVATNECMNAGSTGLVYEDSCVDSTPEQWNNSIPGDHHWENRHYGTQGIVSGTCNKSGTPLFVTSTISGECSQNIANQSWATPAA